MSAIVRDLRHGLRMLRKSPGFAAVTILTLGLGIGATTAIFSVVDGVLLRPLPFEEPERLVMLLNRFTSVDLDQVPLSEPEFLDYGQARSFEGLTAYRTPGMTIRAEEGPERVRG